MVKKPSPNATHAHHCTLRLVTLMHQHQAQQSIVQPARVHVRLVAHHCCSSVPVASSAQTAALMAHLSKQRSTWTFKERLSCKKNRWDSVNQNLLPAAVSDPQDTLAATRADVPRWNTQARNERLLHLEVCHLISSALKKERNLQIYISSYLLRPTLYECA